LKFIVILLVSLFVSSAEAGVQIHPRHKWKMKGSPAVIASAVAPDAYQIYGVQDYFYFKGVPCAPLDQRMDQAFEEIADRDHGNSAYFIMLGWRCMADTPQNFTIVEYDYIFFGANSSAFKKYIGSIQNYPFTQDKVFSFGKVVALAIPLESFVATVGNNRRIKIHDANRWFMFKRIDQMLALVGEMNNVIASPRDQFVAHMARLYGKSESVLFKRALEEQGAFTGYEIWPGFLMENGGVLKDIFGFVNDTRPFRR
jgi:hypothetical protein